MKRQGMQRSTMHVEGIDDKNTLIHVLRRHHFDFHRRSEADWLWLPEFLEAGGQDRLRENVPVILKTSGHLPIGIIVDADDSAVQRWESLKGAFREAAVQTPSSLPVDGFVGFSELYQRKVGCWVMPDNDSDGALEEFLRRLFDRRDALIGYARTATATAYRREARFAPGHRSKAELHCWLAWQNTPGLPYGIAVKAEFFQTDTELAERFVAWFRRLYEPAPPAVA